MEKREREREKEREERERKRKREKKERERERMRKKKEKKNSPPTGIDLGNAGVPLHYIKATESRVIANKTTK